MSNYFHKELQCSILDYNVHINKAVFHAMRNCEDLRILHVNTFIRKLPPRDLNRCPPMY